MSQELACWRCGASLAVLTLPLRRREECPSCRAELHVCRMCTAWDPRVPKKCREEGAEEVRGKDTANFCDWFRPRPGAFDPAIAAAEQRAQGQLAALFGAGTAAPSDPGAAAADALFGPPRKT